LARPPSLDGIRRTCAGVLHLPSRGILLGRFAGHRELLRGVVTERTTSRIGDQGSALPGVTVTLAGLGAPEVQVTDAPGQFRFMGLGPGSYSLGAELEGF
jgi:hypothetical protein